MASQDIFISKQCYRQNYSDWFKYRTQGVVINSSL